MDEMDILRELESHGCCGLDQLDVETIQWIEQSAKRTGFLIVVDQSIPIDALDQFTGPEQLRGAPIIVAAYCDPPVRIWRIDKMMKRFLLPLLLWILALVLASRLAIASTQVTFTWNEPGLASVPACTSATPALTANCITGFNIYNVSATGTRTKVGTLAITDAPTATTTFSLVVPQYPFLGTDTAVATCLFLDQAGTSGETGGSLPASFLYTPADPVLKGTVQ